MTYFIYKITEKSDIRSLLHHTSLLKLPHVSRSGCARPTHLYITVTAHVKHCNDLTVSSTYGSNSTSSLPVRICAHLGRPPALRLRASVWRRAEMKHQKRRNRNSVTQAANMRSLFRNTPGTPRKRMKFQACVFIHVTTFLDDYKCFTENCARQTFKESECTQIHKSRAGRLCCLAHLGWSSCPEVESLSVSHTHTRLILWPALTCCGLCWLPGLSGQVCCQASALEPRGPCLPHGAWTLSINLDSKYTAASGKSFLSSWDSSHGKCRRNKKGQKKRRVEGRCLVFLLLFFCLPLWQVSLYC